MTVTAERGAVAALVALALPVLILSAGLVVDVAYLFWMRTVLQATADFAALAGAQNVDLEALARGERRLLVEPAAADARTWVRLNLAAHPATARYQDEADIDVVVTNAGPDHPARQRWTGRLLTDPTVSVRIGLRVKPFLVRSVLSEVEVAAVADASLLEKADPLD
ncbi:MAG TPA: pilus assembly protein TadG-related protein [Bacillota bacterium]